MLNIFATNTYKNGSRYIFDQLRKVDPKQLRFRHTVIVPDRVSFSAEQEMLSALGGSFNIRVLTFRRFAAEILPDYNYMPKQSALMVLSAVVEQNKESFACYKKGTGSGGFIEDIYETICQFKYSRIPSEKINCDVMPAQIRNKMRDIKLIYGEYEKFIAQKGYIDSAGKMEELLGSIPQSENVKNGYFYIYDFDNFSAQEKAIVSELASASLGVTAVCCHSEKYFHRYLFLNDLLPVLNEAAQRAGIKTLVQKEYSLPPGPPAEQIGNYLYTYQRAEPDKLPPERLTLAEAADINGEVTNLARYITQGVRAGKRYGDYFVVSSDADKYRQAVERVFAEFGIPFFMDTQYCLANHAFVRYILDYFAMRKNNNKLENALSFVKNPFFGENGDVFNFENYCLKYNIGYNYDKFELGTDEKFFNSADKVRKKLKAAIDFITLAAKDKISGFVAAARQLIEYGSLQIKLEDMAREQENELQRYAHATRQVYDKFNALLNAMEDILGDCVYSLDDFLKLLTTGVNGVNVSVLPFLADSVVVTNMAKSKKHDIKNLCILGAAQGAMPIVKRDTKLLSDRNIDQLGLCGLELGQKINLENKRERFNVYQLLLEPTESLYVSYCKSGYDADGGATVLSPSDFFVQLRKLFTQGKGDYPVLSEVCPDVFTEKSALAETVSNKRNLLDRRAVKDGYFAVKSDLFRKKMEPFFDVKENLDFIDCGEELFFGGESTSVSKIEDFYKCPYKHFLRYGLDLRPRKKAELEASDLGSILHAVLEKYVAGAEKNESAAKTKAAAEKCFRAVLSTEQYRPVSGDLKNRYTFELLKNEAVKMCLVVNEQLTNSRFDNMETEMRFGFLGAKARAIELKAGKKIIRLHGVVDRVDAKGDKCVVIDYKSGSNVAYDEGLLYMGQKLQLLVYMCAAVQNFGYKPAGMYYFKLHDNFVDKGAEEKAYKYIGRTVADKDVIADIDTAFYRNNGSARLGVSLNKDGTLRKSKSLLTEEQMDAQLRYALKSIEKAGELMQKGCVSVTPFENACDYCDYCQICGIGDVYDAQPRKKISVDAEKLTEIAK